VDGKTVREELQRIGYVGEQEPGDHPIGAYFETHIEQGPVLEDAGSGQPITAADLRVRHGTEQVRIGRVCRRDTLALGLW
jgi:N-carbamoyl-L-amino-acid hydrolase